MSVPKSLHRLCIGTWLGILILVFFTTHSEAHLGSCEDHNDDCVKWQSFGYCDTNVKFMAPNCPVSCNLCLDRGCFDKTTQCSRFKRLGYCSRHIKEMNLICRHSCDFCQIPEVSSVDINLRSITNPDFVCGIPFGGNANTHRSGRRARQIIFPDELKEFIEGNRRPPPSPMISAMLVDNSPPPVRIDGNVPNAFCGATIIHHRYLITAAHCVLHTDKPVRSVHVGDLDLARPNEANSKPADYEVEQIIIHPDYQPSSTGQYNDIALIKTSVNIEFNDVVYPFCLADTRPPSGSLVTGSGFGFVNNTDRATSLQKADLKIVSNQDCEVQYKRNGLLELVRLTYPELLNGKDILCAAFPGRNACQGDSGGPLFQDDPSGRRFLVGIVSRGFSCRGNGQSDLPGFYASTAAHVKFISSIIYSSSIKS